jgi:hypothetical protein
MKKETEGKVSLLEIHPDFIFLLGERLTANKGKYPPFNYLTPVNTSLLIDACERHLLKVKGQVVYNQESSNDPETTEDHLAAIALNAMMIWYQLKLEL